MRPDFHYNRAGHLVRCQSPRAIRPALERFLDKIELREDCQLDGSLCWLWIKAKTAINKGWK